MARQGKYEDEKNRLDAVREYLEEAQSDMARLQQKAGAEELYEIAEMLRSVKEVLKRAIKLCGKDKPKEVTDGTKT